MTTVWVTLAGVVGGIAVLWLTLVVSLALGRPRGIGPAEMMRLLPDLLRLVGRLARDPGLTRGVRLRLWLLLAYLASPIDLIPDFVPVLGYVDDAIVVAIVLRSVLRRAGLEALARHWPGTPDGLVAVLRLTGTAPPAGSVGGRPA